MKTEKPETRPEAEREEDDASKDTKAILEEVRALVLRGEIDIDETLDEVRIEPSEDTGNWTVSAPSVEAALEVINEISKQVDGTREVATVVLDPFNDNALKLVMGTRAMHKNALDGASTAIVAAVHVAVAAGMPKQVLMSAIEEVYENVEAAQQEMMERAATMEKAMRGGRMDA